MSGGWWHYAEAERLAESVQGKEISAETMVPVVALAQVHATLALASAASDRTISYPGGGGGSGGEAWAAGDGSTAVGGQGGSAAGYSRGGPG